MSELKHQLMLNKERSWVPCYIKSEADKVIAELEGRIADGDRDFELANHQNEMLLKIVRHNKYKRCLAMAKWCETQFAYYIASCDRYDSKYVNKKAFHFYKWKYKWLELAEEYK